ncbi:hypothetical protein BDB00DRAFT_483753 [Zychaea mexicana]|uniref:uncharacterized protein n=1 Tax=Zychaea mexicana TaxID=64656 RepID=UPI0022FE828F|nr:uncharacterized protein BDB00DRAFT_483753 [Zychaea mexicana]KAI9491484.1 hypothetical protein BDB00DRAFT_483753 [Zychaea mexicana]
MADALVSLPTNVWTIHDVIVDSPVWKSNILHLEEQIDHFEKWVEGFMKALKQYIDAVIKYNTQTSNLCKKILPQNLDGSLIDPQVAGMIINTFASTLQCNLAFKTKLNLLPRLQQKKIGNGFNQVSDLEDNLLHPLQRFVKHELKEFKESRRAYERMLDKYDAQMYRYGALSRAKEASALREDAFQTYDVRKTFIRVSREYFTELLAFKANLEHVLVECFSCAMAAQVEEAEEAYQSCAQSRAMLPGWQQWLEESKAMSEYQLEKISKASQRLENVAVRKVRPYRSLRNYITPINSGAVASSPAAEEMSSSAFDKYQSPSPRTSQIGLGSNNGGGDGSGTITTDDHGQPAISKEGYLFTRVVVGKPARYSWIRRWFFVQDGWFGACAVSTVDKVKGCVVIADRVRVSDCTCRVNNEIDRRFLFEVVSNNSNSSMLLQAETEDELQRWIQTIEDAQKQQQLQQQETMTTTTTTTTTEANNVPEPLLTSKTVLDITQLNTGKGPVTMSNSPALTALGASSRELVSIQSTTSRLVSVMNGNGYSASSASMHAVSAPASPIQTDSPPSGTAIAGGGRSGIPHNAPTTSGSYYSRPASSSPPVSRNNTPSSPASTSSWSMPWIMSGFNALASNNSSTDVVFHGGEGSLSRGEDSAIVIYPTRVEMEASVVTLDGYTGELASRHRELRRLFTHVPESEIVIEAFPASLYRQAGVDMTDQSDDHSNDDNSTLPPPMAPPPAYGYASEYGYSGRAYVTQNRLWFYHCSLMTCLNTVVIPLDTIKSVRLEKALSNASHGMLMFVETKSNPPKTFCFGIWLEPAEVVGERLKMAIEAAKDPNSNDIQKLYNHMRCVIPGKIKSKQRPTSHLMQTSTLDAALTPLTVQAHPPSPQPQPSTEIPGSGVRPVSPKNDDIGTTGKEGGGGGRRTVEDQQQQQQQTEHRPSAAAGALTAAMEAANSNAGSAQPSSSSSSSSNTAELTANKQGKRKEIKRSSSRVGSDQENRIDKPLPPGPVVCDCSDHLDKTEAKLVLPTSAEKLFTYMFSDKQSGPHAGQRSIWAKLNATKQNSDPDITEWTLDTDGMKERTLKYVMPLNNPMVKTRDTEVVETQKIITEHKRTCYVVVSSTKTPSLPYADAFIPCIKYCITYVSEAECQLSCCMGVKWLKSIMVKTMVSRAATKGMSDTIKALVPLIEHDALLINPRDTPSPASKRDQQRKQHEQREMQPTPAPKMDNIPPAKLRKQVLIPSAGRLFIVCVVVLFFYALIKRYHPWYRIPPHQYPQKEPSSSTQLIWRAVFLRDLEDGLIVSRAYDGNDDYDNTNSNRNDTIHRRRAMPALEHVNPKIFRTFEEHRNSKWYSMRHQLMGAELTYTRERLGALRYEILTAFKMLNMMDQKILENEYWNWLLDERMRCENLTAAATGGSGTNDAVCADIIKEAELA